MSSDALLPSKAGPVPDRLTIWPVDDGRYGLDASFHGDSGYQRALQHQAELERESVPYSFRHEFESSDPALRGEMTVAITLGDAGGGTNVVGVHEGLPSGVSSAWESAPDVATWEHDFDVAYTRPDGKSALDQLTGS